ncbi:type IV-A pilus assembly ATPase PilB [Neisseria sp. Ec49-e6-T10]
MLSGLARALVQNNILLLQDAEAIQQAAQAEDSLFVTHLIKSKKMSSMELAEFASRTFGFPLLDVSVLEIESLPRVEIEDELLLKNHVVPLFKRGNKLFVAASDPTQMNVFRDIGFASGLAVEVIVALDDKLARILELYGQQTSSAMDGLDEEMLADELPTESLDEEEGGAEDAPVVKFLHKILLDAINIGASDIHFEPYEKSYRVRFRVDGQLREVVQPPIAIKEKLASRIKVISKLDISEKRIPQDGRLKLKVTKTRSIDFRVSTLPTLFGEKIVMRILDSSGVQLGIEQLGFDPKQKEILMEAIHRPYGMVLVTGPTGSGKTVTLYTCLNILNTPDSNISTAEDPAEINLPGINQVNVNDKQGLTFAAALKSFLRQDPDIIMVGEIRDLETADIAIKAAQTGHMVFSTLHTNNAPATLSRLLNMGVAPFNIASSVNLILAQRLVRRLCKCKKPLDIPEEALLAAGFKPEDLDGSWTLYGPNGCEDCRGSGYKGRAGLYEVMPVSDAIQRVIMKNGTAIDIADIAYKEGLIDLRRAGLLKVMQGITSLEEVEANTND